MGYRRNGAHQSLWIHRTLMIDVVIAKDLQIGLGQDVHIGIIGIAITKHEDGCIDGQKTYNHRNRILMVTEEGKE